ncbi:MAG TPA: hypothetical protein VLB67_07820 [Acidimicrobiia bacterium]|nr:hypothetical protein [Acidimicrobiia bacterium]
MTVLTVLALIVAVVGNVLSRAVVLDAIALWPLAALAVPAALVALKGGKRAALLPLMILSWLLVTVGIHLSGVAGMPSSASAIRADLSGFESGRVAISVPSLTLSMGQGPFSVVPAPVGGAAGPPLVEQVAGSTAISLTVTDDPARSPWFRFGEYRLTLPQDVVWDVRVTVAGFDIDLSDVTLSGGRFQASSGRLLLGPPGGAVTVEVAGDVEVSVPRDVPVVAVGTTRVPDGWTVSESGATAPVGGEGWTIRAVAGSVRIVDR